MEVDLLTRMSILLSLALIAQLLLSPVLSPVAGAAQAGHP
jgi:hypothetical protein